MNDHSQSTLINQCQNGEYKVLLVDDDPHILSSFQRQLKGNYRVETANSGSQALQHIESNVVDACVHLIKEEEFKLLH